MYLVFIVINDSAFVKSFFYWPKNYLRLFKYESRYNDRGIVV